MLGLQRDAKIVCDDESTDDENVLVPLFGEEADGFRYGKLGEDAVASEREEHLVQLRVYRVLIASIAPACPRTDLHFAALFLSVHVLHQNARSGTTRDWMRESGTVPV